MARLTCEKNASCTHPVSNATRSTRRPLGRRWRGVRAARSARRDRRCHVVETAQRLGHEASHRLQVQHPAESEGLGERNRGRDRAHPPRVGKDEEECSAGRPDAPGASEAPFDLRTDLLDQAVVLHARGTCIDACHAAKACVPVANHLLVHAHLAARREVHEQDAPARRVHLLTPEKVGRTCGKAETTMHAVRDQRRIGRVVIVERDGRGTSARVAGYSGRTCGHRGHVRCHRPDARDSTSGRDRADASPTASGPRPRRRQRPPARAQRPAGSPGAHQWCGRLCGPCRAPRARSAAPRRRGVDANATASHVADMDDRNSPALAGSVATAATSAGACPRRARERRGQRVSHRPRRGCVPRCPG